MEKKKSVYKNWVIIMLILYVLFQNTFFGATFLVLVCMGAISVIIAKILVESVDIDFDRNISNIVVGERFNLNLIVRNRSFFPTNKMYVKLQVKNFFFDESDVCEVNVPVVIKGEQIIMASIDCKYVGNITLKIKEIIISDYLGIIRHSTSLDRGIDINVMPNGIDLNVKWNTKSEDEDDVDSDAIDALEAYDIKEVREYRDGESLHRIHWNLSSRYDEYMMKEYEIETVTRFNIMIDLSKQSVKLINELIEALCGAVNMVLTMEREFCVYFYDNKTEVVREVFIQGKEDVDRLLEEVYSTEFGEVPGEVYSHYSENKSSDRIDAVYITADREHLDGEIIGEVDDKVVLMCI
ncbi:MAG: DUF58 domain-containing protein [Lachnospiraceae bacterium]|nr:DUF58 domain-containing protein [Lachnospiraceae bacterium]